MTSYLAQANTGSDALASSRAVSRPGGVNAGAVGVFWLARWNEAASFPAVTPPAGAVLRGTIASGNSQTLVYLLKISAETTFTFSWTGGRWSALSALFFDGVDPALDLSITPFQSATGTGTSITTLTLTTVNTAALAWHVHTLDGGVASHTPPTSFTEIADVAPWAAAYRISPADGSQSAAGGTNNASGLWLSGLVALAPASSGGGVTGDAALAATATLSAAGTRATAGSAAVAATAGLTATGVRAASGTAALAASASLTAAGTVGHSEQAALDATAALEADGVREAQADASLTATAALTAQGQVTRIGAASLTAVATLTADGVTGTPPVLGAASLAAAAALTAAGERRAIADAALTATATLAAAGATSATAGASLTATATLTAGGTTISDTDDVDIRVGAPHSPWSAGAPQGDGWEVGAPC
ncbi:hypothetical protein ABZ916_39220 [Streptomyces sp. NPDC046853]|uniref:hypothetical protein n=1 Tax=Streptomyces sp. NPDC046853 TaxID=3154920 RepID=UPI0033C5DC63